MPKYFQFFDSHLYGQLAFVNCSKSLGRDKFIALDFLKFILKFKMYLKF